MREFFKSELKTLYAKTQLRQYETLSAMPDAQEQLTTLFDALCRVCDAYSYIPEQAKKSIVQEQMLIDPEFIGFNAKILSKWFNQAKGRYFKEAAHEPSEQAAKPVAYEDLNPELKSRVDKFIQDLQQPSKYQMPKVTREEINSLKAEDELKAGVKADEYSLADFEREDKLYQHNKRIEYGRIYSDPNSFKGDLLPCSPTFEKWLKDNP